MNTEITTEHFISELVALMRICSATDLIKWTKWHPLKMYVQETHPGFLIDT